jgi:hypothetical protein
MADRPAARRVRDRAHTVEFEAGNHPFLSRPAVFAKSIVTEITAVQSIST